MRNLDVVQLGVPYAVKQLFAFLYAEDCALLKCEYAATVYKPGPAHQSV